MKKMQDTPGLGNIQEMLGKMGLGGGGAKFNQAAMKAHIERQMRFAQQKEKTKANATASATAKAAASAPQMSQEEIAARAAESEKAMAELLEMENGKKLVFRSGTGAERSAKRPEKKAKGKKKGKK